MDNRNHDEDDEEGAGGAQGPEQEGEQLDQTEGGAESESESDTLGQRPPTPIQESSPQSSKPDPEAILDRLGPFGTFQRVWYVLLCLPAGMTATLNMSFAFTAAATEHRCVVPGCDERDSANYSAAFDPSNGFANFSLPSDGDSPSGYSQCQRYSSSSSSTSCRSSSFDPSTPYVNCSSFAYDRSVFQSTIATEFDLVCAQGQVWVICGLIPN